MNPTVYLRRVTPGQTPEQWGDAARVVVMAAGLLNFVKRNDLMAIKLHVGEPGLKTFLPPQVARHVVSLAKERGARPFLTDTSVLYSGPRSNGVGHTEVAMRHGFTLEGAGAPFLPADGLEGNLERSIAIEGVHFKNVGIAVSIADADGLITVSHATGHLASGIGATLKNLGMGCASRKGKLLQHSDTKPFVRKAKCINCAACEDACPEDAISHDDDGKASIEDGKCIGCGECIAQCRSGAIGFNWDSASSMLQEKMVEHALGVIGSKKGKIGYLLGIVNLTKDCDCLGQGSPIVARDIGFAASMDPVALDQAAMDLVSQAEGKRLDELSYPELDGTVQLAYAQNLGLGSRRYDLVEV